MTSRWGIVEPIVGLIDGNRRDLFRGRQRLQKRRVDWPPVEGSPVGGDSPQPWRRSYSRVIGLSAGGSALHAREESPAVESGADRPASGSPINFRSNPLVGSYPLTGGGKIVSSKP